MTKVYSFVLHCTQGHLEVYWAHLSQVTVIILRWVAWKPSLWQAVCNWNPVSEMMSCHVEEAKSHWKTTVTFSDFYIFCFSLLNQTYRYSMTYEGKQQWSNSCIHFAGDCSKFYCFHCFSSFFLLFGFFSLCGRKSWKSVAQKCLLFWMRSSLL